MAKLPNVDDALVDDTKLSGYLLNLSHPRGGAKAAFLMRFGFTLDRPDEARQALLEHARENEIMVSQQTRFGTIFEVEGPLTSPDGRNPHVRSVWMLDHGTVEPRLITMVPLSATRTTRSDP